MPRRGTNIYRRKDARWEGRIKKENDGGAGGKYWYFYGKSYGEVKKKMEDARKKYREYGLSQKYTIGEVMDIWLKECSPYWKQTTYAAYSGIVDKYILPRIGCMQVRSMDEEMMEKFLSGIREQKKLSNRYLRNICSVIIRAMRYVRKKRHYEMEIPENAVCPVKQEQVIPPSEKELTVLESYLLQHAQDDTCIGILIAYHTGLRIGEVCALTWEDIDLDEEVIYIRKNLQRVKTTDHVKNNTEILLQTPKTSASFRIIPIPPVLLPLLKEPREEKWGYIIKGKKKAWAEPRTLQYRFAKILEECGMEGFNFHMLRHAFATRCIARGFDVKSLSEILGHSNTQTTLNLYVHSNMKRKKELMEQFI